MLIVWEFHLLQTRLLIPHALHVSIGVQLQGPSIQIHVQAHFLLIQSLTAICIVERLLTQQVRHLLHMLARNVPKLTMYQLRHPMGRTSLQPVVIPRAQGVQEQLTTANKQCAIHNTIQQIQLSTQVSFADIATMGTCLLKTIFGIRVHFIVPKETCLKTVNLW